jgi:DDE superfamily endonuclease
MRLLRAWIPAERSCRSGASDFSKNDSPGLRSGHGTGVPQFFPPEVIVDVKAIACEFPQRLGLPLSRLHVPDIRAEVLHRGLAAEISGTTIWRWLASDAIRPWSHRSWIFPRDPDFKAKAGRVLDLYARQWEGKPLTENDFVISADEKTSIQARHRCHPTSPPGPRRATRIEHEYERRGALAYLAAWDCSQAKIFGRCETTTGIEPFRRLVNQVMAVEPYASAQRVFWVVDNGSSHRGDASVCRLTKDWPNAYLIHLPVHASWLNQVEIYFSVIQRKVLDPNDITDLDELQQRLLAFERLYQQAAKPFEWKFTRQDLAKLLQRLANQNLQRAA